MNSLKINIPVRLIEVSLASDKDSCLMDKTKALYSMIQLPGQHVGYFCQRYSWNGLTEKAQVASEKKSKDFCLCKSVYKDITESSLWSQELCAA